MAEKNNLIFSDKQIIPTDDLIFSMIGDKKKLWLSIMRHMHENYKDYRGEWNYYNDGKRWLFKMVRKKKTIFWIEIMEDTFRITFWFPNRAETVIEDSDLPTAIKEDFRNARRYGSTRGVSIIMSETSDVENVIKLIGIKVKMK